MMQKKRYIAGLALLLAVWAVITVCCFAKPSEEISESERRKLAQFPEVSVKNILSGKFMTDFEEYTLDQFPLRDQFRTLKAVSVLYLLGQKDNNDIYIADGYAAALEYPLSESSINHVLERFKYVYESYLKDTGSDIYMSVVPDKGYFLAEKNGYPSMDYEKLFSMMQDGMPYAEYIDITDTLDIECYYKTDTHWRQEEIIGTAQKLAKGMGISEYLSGEYDVNEADIPFYGVYHGQAALPMNSETIYYLTNDVISDCTVTNIENDKVTGVYDFEKLDSRDPYEMYLSGARPLLFIENPNAHTDKELIVFRDSFGSSIIPLLTEAYSKITVIDIRYINSTILGDYVEFEKSDVLFLYSTILLNSGYVIK